MTTDEWFERLHAALGTAQPCTPEERAALLDLARLAAHASERWTAPVSTFLAGVALAHVPVRQRADLLRTLVADLETEPPAP